MVTGNKCKDKLTQMQRAVPKMKQIYLQVVAVGMTVANSTYIITFLGVLTLTSKLQLKLKESLHSDHNPTGAELYEDDKLTFIVKYTTLPVTALIDLFLAVKASHSSHLPLSSKAEKLFGCCCYCCSQRMKSKTLQKTFQTLLWWNVMLFIQIHVGQVAPPVFILFIIAPGQTVANVGILALVHILTAIALVYLAQIVYHHCLQKKCGLACAKLMVLAVSLTLAGSVIVIYFRILQAGSNVKGIKGAIIPLAPSILLSFTAWFIRKKIISQRKDNKTSRMEMVTDHDERMEGETYAEEQKHLLQSATESDGSDLA